jgi:hypothetical protein
MKDHPRASVRSWALGLFLLAACSACVLPDFGSHVGGDESEMVSITTNTLTLQWDPPASAIDHYKVYYRVHGATDWLALGDVPSGPLPEYVILHSTLGDGEFDFAVVSVNASAMMSDYHTSLDGTAQPDSGWYVSWSTP